MRPDVNEDLGSPRLVLDVVRITEINAYNEEVRVDLEEQAEPSAVPVLFRYSTGPEKITGGSRDRYSTVCVTRLLPDTCLFYGKSIG